MKETIKKLLSEKRYIHSVGVAETAKKYALQLNADCEKAYLAGLVHDIAKEMNGDELVRYCKENNIFVSQIEILNPSLLHAPAGSAKIKEYGIFDEDIQNAVRYHTVGRAGMSVLEKIIYIADMTEPSRSFDGVEKLRELCEKDFYSGFAEGLRYSMIFNLNQGKLIHEGTLQAWNDLLINNI